MFLSGNKGIDIIQLDQDIFLFGLFFFLKLKIKGFWGKKQLIEKVQWLNIKLTKMKYALTLFCLLVLSSVTYAQRGGMPSGIFGVVLDEKDQSPLIGAHAALKKAENEEEEVATVTNERGMFFFRDVAKGNYILEISYLGYASHRQEITVGDEPVRVGRISLKEGATQLDEVVVKEKLPQAKQIGDTTQYNAGAYKTNPDANAEDLIKKMPGVVVSGGQVQAQGENVGKILVDGREFFGNDPQAALKNLPAEVIQKIQVFDQQSDQSQFTGVDDGNTVKTINIITKSNMRNGQFGKIYAGYGPDDDENRYKVGGSVNFFNKDMRLSVIGQSNNINQQNFATEDLLGVVGGSSRGGRGGRGGGGGGFRGGGGVSDFMVSAQNGIAQTHALGLNYSDKWGEKIEVSGSYFFNQTENDAFTNINRDFFTSSDSSQVYRENNVINSKNINHRLNMLIDYRISETDQIRIRPRLTIQDNDGFDNTNGTTSLEKALLNSTSSEYLTTLSAVDFSNNIMYRHRFGESRRNISLSLTTGYNSNSGDAFLVSQNSFLRGNTIIRDTLNQYSDLLSDGWNLSANLSYSEPIGERGNLQIQYRASTNKTDSDRETYDYDEEAEDYILFNTPLSNVFESNYSTQQVTTSFMNRGKKIFFMLRLTGEFADLKNDQTFPYLLEYDRNFFNILPMGMLRYEWTRQKNLRMFYRTNTQEPSITQLQEVIDNTNPLQLTTGNSSLLQSFQHSVNLRYSSTNTDKSTVFYGYLSGGVTNRYIGTQTYIAEDEDLTIGDVVLPRGAQLSRPVNQDGYWNLRSFVTLGLPLNFMKTNLNLSLSGNYTRTPGLINELSNFANNSTLGLGVVLSSNISEKVDFTLSSRSNMSYVANSLRSDLNQQYFNQNTEFGMNLIFGPGIVFRTSMANQLYSGLSDDFNQNFWLWNAAIAKKLFKNQRGELQLSVFDLLEQNNSIQRNITNAYIEDVESAVLQRYVMLTFTYQLRNFGQGNADQDDNRGRDRRPPWGRQ